MSNQAIRHDSFISKFGNDWSIFNVSTRYIVNGVSGLSVCARCLVCPRLL